MKTENKMILRQCKTKITTTKQNAKLKINMQTKLKNARQWQNKINCFEGKDG